MKLRSFIFTGAMLVAAALAAEPSGETQVVGSPYRLRFTAGRFTPEPLSVPTGTPIILEVSNTSAEAIEFESYSLNRERVIEPGKTIVLRLPPLKPGVYDFFDDFHSNVPEGKIIASPSPATNPAR